MILGVLVYAGFALYRGITQIGESLRRLRVVSFALACALAFSNYLTRFLKWEYYLARLGIRGVPKLDSLLTFLSGLVLTVTPGKVGEVFKSLVLASDPRRPGRAHGPDRARRAAHRRARHRHPHRRRERGFFGRTRVGAVGRVLVLVCSWSISSDRFSSALLGPVVERGTRAGRRNSLPRFAKRGRACER